jgi:hypothetical protein
LKRLYEKGDVNEINQNRLKKIQRILLSLDSAKTPKDSAIPTLGDLKRFLLFIVHDVVEPDAIKENTGK